VKSLLIEAVAITRCAHPVWAVVSRRAAARRQQRVGVERAWWVSVFMSLMNSLAVSGRPSCSASWRGGSGRRGSKLAHLQVSPA
jgi:hypothetical protein